MESFFLVIIIFLFCLAIFDLFVGVSNDAVNFLNSAIGAKVAPFKTVMMIAAVGVLVGASLSNGMMEIARHGIYQPDQFYFTEIICILLGVMLTDVILLDIFNTLGMPTSTTVSMVFELLGGTFMLALLKIMESGGVLTFGQLLNTDKALSVILGIFLSVAIAFFFGAIVQYLTRILFTFNYKKNSKYFIAVFGGLAITAIIYFMLIKGLSESSFMTDENKKWIHDNTSTIIGCSFVGFSILMEILHLLKVNVFKVIVLFGTFALALAFAGNDLVNFIGVPLAGYSSYMDYMASGATVAPNEFLMESLLAPARTPWYFLIGAGVIMVFALCTSKKAQNVVKTSVDLSRQEEGEEHFGTSRAARSLVRASSNIASFVEDATPMSVKKWISSRFDQKELIMENQAAFDLVRASVNLVLAGLLVAVGTSLKLPLSTTYVTFMVAMGTSLADRAWGRESAVYRITGVLAVIGGWFVTAGAAFTACAIITLILYYGGPVVDCIMMAFATFILIRSQLSYKKKLQEEKDDALTQQLIACKDPKEALVLLRKYVAKEQEETLTRMSGSFALMMNSFLAEKLKGLRKASGQLSDEKDNVRKLKRMSTIGIRRLDEVSALEKSLYLYQGNDFLGEIVYSIDRICEPCREHVDNNFLPLEESQKKDIEPIFKQISEYMKKVGYTISHEGCEENEELIHSGDTIINTLALLKKGQLKRIQSQESSLKISILYLTILQETQNIMAYTTNLLKVSRKFQLEA